MERLRRGDAPRMEHLWRRAAPRMARLWRRAAPRMARLWRRASALRSVSFSRLFLELGEPRQRLNRRQAIEVDRGQLFPQYVSFRRVEQPKLPLRLGRRAAERRPSAARELIAFERRQA